MTVTASPVRTPGETDALERAFRALAECLTALTPLAGTTPPADIAVAREATEAQAVAILQGLPPSSSTLLACLRTPSLTLLKLIFEGPDAAIWREHLLTFAEHFADGDERPTYFLPFTKASVAHLLYLDDLGFSPLMWKHDLLRRYPLENDPAIDELVARAVSPEAGSSLLSRVLQTQSRFLNDIAPGRGCRHIAALEVLIRKGQDTALIAHLQQEAGTLLGAGSWRHLALLLRMGLDLSGLDDKAITPRLRELLDLSASAHGRMEIIRREPDLTDMLARPEVTGAYFGAAGGAFLAK